VGCVVSRESYSVVRSEPAPLVVQFDNSLRETSYYYSRRSRSLVLMVFSVVAGAGDRLVFSAPCRPSQDIGDGV
jgi:hypothetical protein